MQTLAPYFAALGISHLYLRRSAPRGGLDARLRVIDPGTVIPNWRRGRLQALAVQPAVTAGPGAGHRAEPCRRACRQSWGGTCWRRPCQRACHVVRHRLACARRDGRLWLPVLDGRWTRRSRTAAGGRVRSGARLVVTQRRPELPAVHACAREWGSGPASMRRPILRSGRGAERRSGCAAVSARAQAYRSPGGVPATTCQTPALLRHHVADALRMETAAAFDCRACAAAAAVRDGLVDGLRVDHVRRLPTHADTCAAARAARRCGPWPGRAGRHRAVRREDPGARRTLPDDAVHGTTGYDFRTSFGVLHDGGASRRCSRHGAVDGRSGDFATKAYRARGDLAGPLQAEFLRAVRAWCTPRRGCAGTRAGRTASGACAGGGCWLSSRCTAPMPGATDCTASTCCIRRGRGTRAPRRRSLRSRRHRRQRRAHARRGEGAAGDSSLACRATTGLATATPATAAGSTRRRIPRPGTQRCALVRAPSRPAPSAGDT